MKILEIPKPYLFAGIMTFALLGTYAVNGSTFDVVVLLVLGVLGYLMRRFGFPITPMIVGAILGPLAEVQLRRALDIAGGDLLTLVSTPFTIVVYLTCWRHSSADICYDAAQSKRCTRPSPNPTGSTSEGAPRP